MKKIVFVGLVLTIGLFSLQYNLIGKRGYGSMSSVDTTSKTSNTDPRLDTVKSTIPVVHYCPEHHNCTLAERPKYVIIM